MRIDDFTDPSFDLDVYIQDRLREVLFNTPDPETGRTLADDMRREEARFLYGTGAVKPRGALHTQSRREKRRKRK